VISDITVCRARQCWDGRQAVSGVAGIVDSRFAQLSASTAWVRSICKGTTSSARSWVADSRTGAAAPARAASSHRAAQTHQLSPGESPSKPHPGRGVDKSFPAAFENSKNSLVTIEQTVCEPVSASEVLQQPSRKNPVTGSVPHSTRSVPKTFWAMCHELTNSRVRKLQRSVAKAAGKLAPTEHMVIINTHVSPNPIGKEHKPGSLMVVRIMYANMPW